MIINLDLDLENVPDRELRALADDLRAGHGNCAPRLCLHAQLAEELRKAAGIKEPTGLGAVVEDSRGRRWTRAGTSVRPWYRSGSWTEMVWASWDDLHAVQLLAPGVEQ